MKTIDPGVYGRLDKHSYPDSRGCLIWTAERTVKGYAITSNFRRKARAARMAYACYYGEFPSATVDHICRNTSCVNPLHLEAVTAEENLRRALPFRLARAEAARRMKKQPIPHHPPTAAEVRACRDALGMDRREFAAAVGWTYESVRNWERGRSRPGRRPTLRMQQLMEERCDTSLTSSPVHPPSHRVTAPHLDGAGVEAPAPGAAASLWGLGGPTS